MVFYVATFAINLHPRNLRWRKDDAKLDIHESFLFVYSHARLRNVKSQRDGYTYPQS